MSPSHIRNNNRTASVKSADRRFPALEPGERQEDERERPLHLVRIGVVAEIAPAAARPLPGLEPIADAELRVVGVRHRPGEVRDACRFAERDRNHEEERPDDEPRPAAIADRDDEHGDPRDHAVHRPFGSRVREQDEEERRPGTLLGGRGFRREPVETGGEQEAEEAVLEARGVPDDELRRRREERRADECAPRAVVESPSAFRARTHTSGSVATPNTAPRIFAEIHPSMPTA
jgi:hypothetical protein